MQNNCLEESATNVVSRLMRPNTGVPINGQQVDCDFPGAVSSVPALSELLTRSQIYISYHWQIPIAMHVQYLIPNVYPTNMKLKAIVPCDFVGLEFNITSVRRNKSP